jgi:cyanate permease
VGQQVDGDPAPLAGHRQAPSTTRAVALRTPYFWVLVAGVSTSGLLGTAVIFHQISLLGERGLSPTQAAAVFLPMTAAGIIATLAVGYLIDRFDHPRLLVVASMGLLALGLAWATVLTPGWSAWGYGAVMGAAANAIRAVEAALTPRMFGTGHIASIRSILAAVGVASTAVGPVMFALAHDATGSYTAILLSGIVLPLGVTAAAVATRLPAHATRAVRL